MRQNKKETLHPIYRELERKVTLKNANKILKFINHFCLKREKIINIE
jgi:hypothetical protein